MSGKTNTMKFSHNVESAINGVVGPGLTVRRIHLKKSFIYKYKISTCVKPRVI